MKRYIVTADYYDWDGMIVDHFYGIVDETKPFYKAKDTDGKVRELIRQIKQDADANAGITEVCIHVYELGNEVTDKFLNNKDI